MVINDHGIRGVFIGVPLIIFLESTKETQADEANYFRPSNIVSLLAHCQKRPPIPKSETLDISSNTHLSPKP